MTENIQPDESQPSNVIISSHQHLSDLDPIEQSLYEKIKLAKTPEEVQNYLNLLEQRQAQIEHKLYTNLQLKETQNQIKYERKLTIYKESLAATFSITSIVLGMCLVRAMPLISPLLIVFGLIKPLEYSIREVIELIKGLSQSERPSKELGINKKQ